MKLNYILAALLLLFLSACTNLTSYPNHCLDFDINGVNKIFLVEKFYIGKINSDNFYDEDVISYEMDINKLNRDDLIKYFIIAYNKRYKTNYNAMVDISIKKSFVFLDNGELYDIQGLLLNIKK